MEKKLPIGIEDFAEIRREGFYYIDKSGFIRELLQNWGKVNLFTRPRRFGKSLNMSMLKSFFEIDADKTLFDGLEISQETELCEEYMGKFPVISISLKDVNAYTYEDARIKMSYLIKREVRRMAFLFDSEKLSAYDKETFSALLRSEMSEPQISEGLYILCELLQKHYEKKVIVLIDEYDVPLDKAFENGYYNQMVILLRNLLGQVLKTNESLYFAVLTGCLRVAKESIFTGLNNFNVFSITDVYLDEYFGFTDREVQELLNYYGLEEHYEETKAWYDGYRFGKAEVYCPWDVINYCRALRADSEAEPLAYWANTSGNSIVKRLLQKATKQTRQEIERLIEGEAVEKVIRQELTYSELDENIENLWSVLFMTGYLTCQGRVTKEGGRLVIPNREIRELFVNQVWEWFGEEVANDRSTSRAFCEALKKGSPQEITEQFNAYLMKTISIRDTFVKKERKEGFYHGVLLGILGSEEEWIVQSNTESGEGYSDILVEIEHEGIGIVIEVKYAEHDALEASCIKAVRQIKERNYAQRLRRDGMKKIWAYGIACFRKHCWVVCEEI